LPNCTDAFGYLFQQVILLTEQIFKGVSVTGEYYNLFVYSITLLTNVCLLVRSTVCHFQMDYWMCATELFHLLAICTSILNCKPNLQCIHQEKQIQIKT